MGKGNRGQTSAHSRISSSFRSQLTLAISPSRLLPSVASSAHAHSSSRSQPRTAPCCCLALPTPQLVLGLPVARSQLARARLCRALLSLSQRARLLSIFVVLFPISLAALVCLSSLPAAVGFKVCASYLQSKFPNQNPPQQSRAQLGACRPRASICSPKMAIPRASLPQLLVLCAVIVLVESSTDTNSVFSPCGDTLVQRSDGFTFGIAFAARLSFFVNNTVQLSPCDRRLPLASSNAQISVFRAKIDEISLLTVNNSNFFPDSVGGYMVAFAGRRYAARSVPAFVGNNTFIVTSFTLVHEFKKGRLQNLYWKRDGCASCSGQSNFVCLNNQDCAIRTNSCKNRGQRESVDCSLGIQLAFSGTDKHERVFNSWYEVQNLRQYSLYGLYSGLRDSLTGLYNKIS